MTRLGLVCEALLLNITKKRESEAAVNMADNREKGLQDYRKKLLEHKEIDGRLKECKFEFFFCSRLDVIEQFDIFFGCCLRYLSSLYCKSLCHAVLKSISR